VRSEETRVLVQHCRLLEDELEAQARKAGIFTHPDNIGGARECFVKGFLQDNLPPKLRLWTGEIIDHTVTPQSTERRKQVDVAIARDDVPAFRIGGDKYLMPCEAVLATVEVKSNLSKDHFFNALDAIRAWRTLQRLPSVGFKMVQSNIPDRILNYIFAFQGPTVETLIRYMEEYTQFRGVLPNNLFDLCVVLRRFTIVPNNASVFVKAPEGDYAWLEQKQDNLASFLAALFNSACMLMSSPPNLAGYFVGRQPNPERGGTVSITEGGILSALTGTFPVVVKANTAIDSVFLERMSSSVVVSPSQGGTEGEAYTVDVSSTRPPPGPAS